jgi:3'-phosphoadenosine 5'-phosphosulfate sulfotransferase (PAPS reductase)/FAD synthetase
MMAKEHKYTAEDLRKLQSLPLSRKIQISQTRILEWYQHFGGKVCVSFSGGKDSTVLLDLARRCFPEVEAVYVDTGLEFPEVREFAMSRENVTVLKPQFCKVCEHCEEGCYPKVLKTYGWCYPSKDVAYIIDNARKGTRWAVSRLNGNNAVGEPVPFLQDRVKKWGFLKDSKFPISHKCCEIMKEKPLSDFRKQTGKKPYIGTLATESWRRKNAWLWTGCNAFDSRNKTSKPLSFWTEQDVLRYLRDFNIPYASVYGEIVEDKKGKLSTTGEDRTGCVFCPIGAKHGKNSRFERLKTTHPELYDHCINKLGLGKFLDFVGIKY